MTVLIDVIVEVIGDNDNFGNDQHDHCQYPDDVEEYTNPDPDSG